MSDGMASLGRAYDRWSRLVFAQRQQQPPRPHRRPLRPLSAAYSARIRNALMRSVPYGYAHSRPALLALASERLSACRDCPACRARDEGQRARGTARGTAARGAAARETAPSWAAAGAPACGAPCGAACARGKTRARAAHPLMPLAPHQAGPQRPPAGAFNPRGTIRPGGVAWADAPYQYSYAALCRTPTSGGGGGGRRARARPVDRAVSRALSRVFDGE